VSNELLGYFTIYLTYSKVCLENVTDSYHVLQHSIMDIIAMLQPTNTNAQRNNSVQQTFTVVLLLHKKNIIIEQTVVTFQ